MKDLDPAIAKMVDRMTLQLAILLSLQLVISGNILFILLKSHG